MTQPTALTSTLFPDPSFVSLDTGPDPRPNTKPDPNAGDFADGRPRQGPYLGIAHPDATRKLQVPPEDTALENGGLGKLSLPHPVALQGKVVLYSCLLKNFPVCGIRTVKGFSIVIEAKVDVFFWNFLAFSVIQWMLAI